MSRSSSGIGSGSGSSEEGGPPPSYQWFHALDAFLYFLLVIASLYRCFLRWKSEHVDPSSTNSNALRRIIEQYATFVTLIMYCTARSVVEAMTAAEYFNAQFGTFQFNVVASVPGALFALTQTAMIARWVRTAEAMVMTMRYARYPLGSVALFASGVLLVCFTILLIIAEIDFKTNFSGLPHNNWTTILNELEGFIYTFNGVCFVALGLQLAYFWKTVSESGVSSSARWRIALIAVFFAGILIARGLLLCIDGAAQNSERLGVILSYAVGPPSVLLVEWVCLVVCFFVLQPSRSSTQQSGLESQFSVAMSPEVNAPSFTSSPTDSPSRGRRFPSDRSAQSPGDRPPQSPRFSPMFARNVSTEHH
jgi:hypothetical protein